MIGYEASLALVSVYERHRAKIVESLSRQVGERVAFARKLVDEICQIGQGKFNFREVWQAVESDIVNGDPTVIRAIPAITSNAPSSKLAEIVQAASVSNNFYHSGDLGDIIFALPGLKELGNVSLYIGPDPLTLVCCFPNKPRQLIDKANFDFLAPLLKAQPYLAKVEWAPNFTVNWRNLNAYRRQFIDGGYHLNLAVEQAKSIGVSPVCVQVKWLTVPGGGPRSADVVIARSPRYHNPHFPWAKVVEKYGKLTGFVGLRQEHADFCKEFGSVRYLPVKNALELAQVIDQCKLFIGNASAPQAIAEGLKKDCIVERYREFEHAHFPRPNSTYFMSGTLALPDIDDAPVVKKPAKSKRAKAGPKFYHLVSRYIPTDPETIRRVNYAAASWDILYRDYGVTPLPVWTVPRDSTVIGDNRKVHFIKDVLQAGLDTARKPDDIIMLTNDDVVVLPEAIELIKAHVQKYGCCGSFRYDCKAWPANINLLRQTVVGHVQPITSQGRDMFAFTKRWLTNNFAKMPDYLLGTNDWDYILAIIMRLNLGLRLDMRTMPDDFPETEIPRGYVWHEAHFPWASRIENRYASPAQRHNKALTKKFFADYKLYQLTF